jgi:hypothetical protein
MKPCGKMLPWHAWSLCTIHIRFAIFSVNVYDLTNFEAIEQNLLNLE